MLNCVPSLEKKSPHRDAFSCFEESWIDADVIWEARDSSRNMHRFYRVSLRASLFSPWTVKRSWGRIGSVGRSTVCICDSFKEACEIVSRLVRLRARRSIPYCLVFSHVRGSDFERDTVSFLVESDSKGVLPMDYSLGQAPLSQPSRATIL